jgi:hypothetical protein
LPDHHLVAEYPGDGKTRTDSKKLQLNTYGGLSYFVAESLTGEISAFSGLSSALLAAREARRFGTHAV